jgi:hypothetical protein
VYEGTYHRQTCGHLPSPHLGALTVATLGGTYRRHTWGYLPSPYLWALTVSTLGGTYRPHTWGYLPSPYLGGSTLCRAVPASPHRLFSRLLHEPSTDRYFCGLQLVVRGHESAITVFRMLKAGRAKRPWSGLSWKLNTSVQDHVQACYWCGRMRKEMGEGR